METVSKIGRPRVIDPGWEKELVRLEPNVKTRRGRQNHHYEAVAMDALGMGKEPSFDWLLSHDRVRRSILSALGRIEDTSVLRAVALSLCELKPKTRDAIAMVRNHRGVAQAGDALGLANLLIRTINRYLQDHRGTTWGQVAEALDTAKGKLPEDAVF